jgi:hypothetical protein
MTRVPHCSEIAAGETEHLATAMDHSINSPLDAR